jgi:hypothetical protein
VKYAAVGTFTTRSWAPVLPIAGRIRAREGAARKREYDEYDLMDVLFAGRQSAYEVHCPEDWVIP